MKLCFCLLLLPLLANRQTGLTWLYFSLQHALYFLYIAICVFFAGWIGKVVGCCMLTAVESKQTYQILSSIRRGFMLDFDWGKTDGSD